MEQMEEFYRINKQLSYFGAAKEVTHSTEKPVSLFIWKNIYPSTIKYICTTTTVMKNIFNNFIITSQKQ